MASFHDHHIDRVTIDALAAVIRLDTSLEANGARLVGIAEFTGVAAYHFAGDAFGTILDDLAETDPFALYEAFAEEIQASWRATGGHASWVHALPEARAFITANPLRGFEIISSVGMVGAIWCRAFSGVVHEVVTPSITQRGP